MIIRVADLDLNYEVYGQGKRLLLLHGWGLTLHTFDKVTPELAKKFQVITLDLPGFGGSSNLTRVFSPLDFAYFVEKFLETLEIKKISLLGHSFGGTVALFLSSSSNRVEKLILVDSAGLYAKTFWTQLKIFLYKIFKKSVPVAYRETVKKILGSTYYRNAGSLRETLIKVVNSHVDYLLPKVNVPTLIIWGERDEITTLREARNLNTGIKNSSIIFLKNCGHFPHLENPGEFVKIITEFLTEN